MSFLNDKNAPIFIAGHRGMVGSAILRKLQSLKFTNLLCKTRQELDLLDQKGVSSFFKSTKPKYVFLAAARVGGIKANNDAKYEFLYENLVIQNNIINNALSFNCEKLLFLGSSCIYPKLSPQPIKEEYLLTGSLEQTNEGYALAKITGLKQCEYIFREKNRKFISAMPTNLYGPGDNFDPDQSHVIPGLIYKLHKAKVTGAKTVELWGTGKPMREFLHVDDCAEGIVTLMDQYEDPTTVNLGCGSDISISDLAHLIKEIVGFSGSIEFNPLFPDGTPRKLLDTSRIRSLGWKPRIELSEGIRAAYEWGLGNNFGVKT